MMYLVVQNWNLVLWSISCQKFIVVKLLF